MFWVLRTILIGKMKGENPVEFKNGVPIILTPDEENLLVE